MGIIEIKGVKVTDYTPKIVAREDTLEERSSVAKLWVSNVVIIVLFDFIAP